MYPTQDTLQHVIKAWWCDRRREKHYHFPFSWMNTTTQAWSLKLKTTIFKIIPEEKQQLVEEKDADDIRKGLLQIIHSVVLTIKFVFFIQVPSRLFWFTPLIISIFFCCCWSTLKWKSRNITKHLMSGPSGNQLVILFSLESWCFPRLRLRTLGKSNLTVSLVIWH